MTTKATKSEGEESPYATTAEELKGGKPAGPEHDGSFHAPDFYDEEGKRIPTDWDSEAQKNDPGVEPPPPAEPTPAPTTSSSKENK